MTRWPLNDRGTLWLAVLALWVVALGLRWVVLG